MSVASRTVPLEPFQRRFAEMEAAPRTAPGWDPKDAANTIAVRLGWFTTTGWPDGPRVRRALGLRPDTPYVKGSRRYASKPRQRVGHETALRLCKAMDLDPVEIDL